MYEYDEIYHHGIKGQKWGVRRFQTKDGSLTPAGKKRRSLGQVIKDHKTAKKRKAALEKARQVKAEKKEKELSETEKKEHLLKSTNAKELYENRHLLSDAELNARINRIDLETRLAGKITTENTQKGMNKVNDMMKNTSNTLENATNLYRKVDNAYSTVTNSSIGKLLAKKLGMEPPKKEFNLDEALKNINKLDTAGVLDLNKRLTAQEGILSKAKSIKEREAKEQEDKTKKEAQKQVDDYNKNWFDNDVDSVRATDYRKKADDIIDGEFREIEISNVSSAHTTRGENFIAGLLEDKSR